ncbi:hypothetical protein HGRIS_014691 [Hohenbuehelia grisea]|uniref:Uncharacterized protein n=1 Tax=Hohenbuehelia grisea TaxID=104357 RepID=A0ABR3JWG5_9AGAR
MLSRVEGSIASSMIWGAPEGSRETIVPIEPHAPELQPPKEEPKPELKEEVSIQVHAPGTSPPHCGDGKPLTMPPRTWKKDDTVVSTDEAYTAKNEFQMGDCTIPDAHSWGFEIDEKGVFQVYEDVSAENKKPAFDIPDIREYFVDLDYVLGVISDGHTKSFAFRRMKYLVSKLTMYSLLNEN